MIKFEHLKIEDDKDLAILSKESIFAELKDIKDAIMDKFHHSYCHFAVFRAMKTRCIIHSNDTDCLIIRSAYETMIKEYKTGDIDWPGAFSSPEFSPLMHMFVKNEISEC